MAETHLPTTAEYTSFVGKNPSYYLQKFNKFSFMPMSFHASWHWPAFLASFWWFLYRKMYLWAGLCFVSMCIPYINFVAWIGWAVAANYLYFQHTQKKISELKAYQPDSYQQYLVSIGGVHGWVPIVSVIVTLLPLLFIGCAVVGMSSF